MWNKRLFGMSPQWLLYFSGREFMTTSYLKFILKKCKNQTTSFLEVTNFSYTVGNKVVIMNFKFGKKIKVCIIYSWKEQKSYFSYFCTYFHYNFCPLPYPCVLPLPGWYISSSVLKQMRKSWTAVFVSYVLTPWWCGAFLCVCDVENETHVWIQS